MDDGAIAPVHAITTATFLDNMTCNVLMGTLNPTQYSLYTQSRSRKAVAVAVPVVLIAAAAAVIAAATTTTLAVVVKSIE